MGVRVYIPALGRFLSVDPVQGGTPNNYVYALDPVNEFDLDGKAIPLLAIGVAALYIGGVAWASYDMWKNPTPANLAWLVVSVVPGPVAVKYSSKIAKVVNSVRMGREYKSTMSIGRDAHKAFQKKYGLSEQTIKGYGRADGMTKTHVLELKPHNKPAMSKGIKQLERYTKGSGKSGQLWTYKKLRNGKYRFSCQRGC